MPYIECCNQRRHCIAYRIENIEGVLLNHAYYLEACPVCGHSVLLIKSFYFNGFVAMVRKTNDKARKLLEKIRPTIMFKILEEPILSGSAYFLRYNEYGCIKKCYSNLSSLQMGQFESLDLPNIPEKLPLSSVL